MPTVSPDPAESTPTEPSRPLSEVKAELFKALGHPARVRVLEVLATGEHTVSEMQPLVGIESSHLSQQLGVLRRTGVVSTRKEGPTVVYSLKDAAVADLLAAARQVLLVTLADTRELLSGLSAEVSR